MIGDIVQSYSEAQYLDPRTVQRGMLLRKGCPKSLYRPGSSTTVLLFQENRIEFAPDLLRNLYREDVWSRFSESFGRTLVETDLKVRSTIGARKEQTRRGRQQPIDNYDSPVSCRHCDAKGNTLGPTRKRRQTDAVG